MATLLIITTYDEYIVINACIKMIELLLDYMDDPWLRQSVGIALFTEHIHD